MEALELEIPVRRGGRRKKPENEVIAAVAVRVRPVPDAEISLHVFLNALDKDYRDRYRNTLSKDEALIELARLRSIAQIASEEINQRQIPDEDECMICATKIAHGRKVTQMVNVRNPETGTIETKVLCSIECVRQYNRKKMGLAELVK